MNRSLLVALAGLVIIAVAIGLNYLPGPAHGPGDDDDARPPPTAEAPPAEPPPMAQPTEERRILEPTFDVVRVNPGGDAVFAGRGEPGSTVIIRDGDTVIGQATPDERGEWVFVPETPLEPGSRRLSLEMQIAGRPAVVSQADVVLVVPEPGKDIAGRPAADKPGALALNVPGETGGQTTVLQTPADAEDAGPLNIEVVDYDDATPDSKDAKEVRISGRSIPGSSVRVYLDDTLLGEAIADVGGRWYLSPQPAPAAGEHTLRADQVAADGKVVARVEVPLEPVALVTSTGAEGAISIEPGHNLWRIAQNRYGTGFAYTVIYEANRDQIKDPDLIYPGQVFTLPPATN